MDIYNIIDTKRKGLELTKEQIEYIVSGAASGELPDYQLSALLMAICIQGASKAETFALANTMASTGQTVDFSDIEGMFADKHSSGGVGDATTLIVAPVCAAAGINVAKMSGRGLGYTGGTIDKLESIPGINLELSDREFKRVIQKHGFSVIKQSDNIAPADKRLYAIRDATATVESIPLIASSIMSKKLAIKTDALVLDVKCGKGAFMKSRQSAMELAKTMVDIGKNAGRKTRAIVSNMDQPLGLWVGNAMEICEAVEILCGKNLDSRLARLSIELCANMLELIGKSNSIDEARVLAIQTITSGRAHEKLLDVIEAQGGDKYFVSEQGSKQLLSAKHRSYIYAEKDGFISRVDALSVGVAARYLGAGRQAKEDTIDSAVGIICKVEVGDHVSAGQQLFELHVNDTDKLSQATELLNKSVEIFDCGVEIPPLIFDIIE